MSRRKQAFPVRVEGSKASPSVETGSPLTQETEEPSSTSFVAQGECDLNIPSEVVLLRPPNDLSGDDEFIVTSTVCDEPETNEIFPCEGPSLHTNEAESLAFSPHVKEEPFATLYEEKDSLLTTPCTDSSDTVKDGGLCTSVTKNGKCKNLINIKEQKLLCSSCNHHSRCICKDVENNAEENGDLDVRTSFTSSSDGTEIEIIQNCNAEKTEVQCVTNLLLDSTFEVLRKQQHDTTPLESRALGMKNQMHLNTELLKERKSNETSLQAILPFVKVDASDLSVEPELSDILSCTDSISIIRETNLSTFPAGGDKQCEMIDVLEPDSSTILLDEYDLHNSTELSHGMSPGTLSNGEFIDTNDIYDESKQNVLVQVQHSFPKSESDSQYLSPSVNIEPNIILDGQHPPNISDCSDSLCNVNQESVSTTVDEREENGLDMDELKSPLHDSCLPGDDKDDRKSTKVCCNWDVKSSLIYQTDTENNIMGHSGVAKGKVPIVRKSKRRKHKKHKRLHESKGYVNKHGASEIKDQTFMEEHLYDSDETQLHAILPCVDVHPALFKEEQENVGNVLKVKSNCDLSMCKEVEQSAEMCRDMKDEIFEKCTTTSETKITLGLVPRRGKVLNTAKMTENIHKVHRKECRKTKRSVQKGHSSETETHHQPYTKHKALTKIEETPVQDMPCMDVDPSLVKAEEPVTDLSSTGCITITTDKCTGQKMQCVKTGIQKSLQMCLMSNHAQHNYEDTKENSEMSNEHTRKIFEQHIPGTQVRPCVTDEEIRRMVDFTEDALDEREKKLQQIREAVYRKRALETDEQRQARLEKDKLRQRKRRAEETEEQREKRLLTMRLHKRIKRSMHSGGLQKNFLDYYMEEMLKYPETQEEQGSPLNMVVSIDPSWVVSTVEKQQFKCTVETEEQRRVRLEKDMLRQRRKRAEETAEQRAKRLETMRINKRIRRAMETEEQRHRRLEYSRERQLYKRSNETPEQREQRLEREKLRQRQKRALESSEEKALRLQTVRDRMKLSASNKDSNIFDNLLNSDSFGS